MSDATGIIETPNYPQRYPRTTTCEWIIDFGYGIDVTLTFTYFDLEQQPNCTYDYLMLHHGIGNKAPKLGENYCGFKAPDQLTVVGPLTVVFHSDYDTEFSGFASVYSTAGNFFGIKILYM